MISKQTNVWIYLLLEFYHSNFLKLIKKTENWKFQKLIKENLQNVRQEPEYKDSIGYMFGGAQLHVHKDVNIDNLIHTRFNVYVKIPEIGGYPVYNGNVLENKKHLYI